MPSKPLLLAALLLLPMGIAGCSTTAHRSNAPPARLFASREFVPEKRRVTEPFAHVLFCVKVSGECAVSSRPVAVPNSAANNALLLQVNEEVNRAITPRNDPGSDTWTLSPKSGDCEDYAITKRHLLIARGWPASALRLAVGRTDAEEGHVVLVARMANGDLVLDNRFSAVNRWADADIRWLSIQSSTNPRVWFQVSPAPDELAVADGLL